MNEQQARSDQLSLPPLPEAISWQYIVLALVLALLIVAIAAKPILVDRARRVVDLNGLALTEHYEDVGTGIGLDYPAGWTILPGGSGVFSLANFDAAPVDPNSAAIHYRSPEESGQVLFDFSVYPRQVIGVPNEWTPAEVVAQIASQVAGRSGSRVGEVVETTVGGKPAARMHYSEGDIDSEFVVLAPDETSLTVIQATVVEGTWAGVRSLFENILGSVTIADAAE